MELISHIDDILDDVLKKHSFRYPREQLKEAVQVYFKFLVSETKTNDVYAMKIPYLGHLYKSFKLDKNSAYRFSQGTKEREEKENLLKEFRYNIDESIGFKAHDYYPYSFEYHKALKNDFELRDVYLKDKQCLEVLTIVEDKQNNKCKTK